MGSVASLLVADVTGLHEPAVALGVGINESEGADLSPDLVGAADDLARIEAQNTGGGMRVFLHPADR